MEKIVFDINERSEKGKKTRAQGQIPCILQGKDIETPIPVKMSKKDVSKLCTYPKTSIFTLKLNGKDEACIVKELQKDIYGKVIHIDFDHVNMDEKIKIKIPVALVGQAKLKSKGLLAETFVSEIEVFGEVDKLPKQIELDVSELNYDDKVLAKDLTLPEGIKLDIHDDVVIAKIDANETEEDEEETAAEE